VEHSPASMDGGGEGRRACSAGERGRRVRGFLVGGFVLQRWARVAWAPMIVVSVTMSGANVRFFPFGWTISY
jgi:hypothetical protein